MANSEQLTGHYGELYCPDSMIYTDKNGNRMLEVFASNDLPEERKQSLLAEIDQLIRKHL